VSDAAVHEICTTLLWMLSAWCVWKISASQRPALQLLHDAALHYRDVKRSEAKAVAP
jgi:hypothetical protein